MSAASTSIAAPNLRLPAAAAGIPKAKRAVLTGWGRYPSAPSDLYRPEKISELKTVVSSDSASVLARGAGRAYGDAALNADNRVVDLGRLNRMLAFDPATGVLRCEAGVTIDEIIDVFLPRGFFPPVVPGTRFVTMGGAVAADVHGKNHHRDSSLGSHVTSFDLMLASGEVRRCSREENSELFWATLGGMGLTGVILAVELALRRIESAYIDGKLVRAADIDEAIEAFERTDSEFGLSVAWIDCMSGRGPLGRSVLSVGNFASRDALTPALAQEPFQVAPKFRAAVPFNLPSFALSSISVRAFNALVYAIHRDTGRTIFDYQGFFFPLDSIRDWNRIYGKRGFIQYQCVWPLNESRAGLIEVLDAVGRSGRGSFLAVLKKFGAQEGMLSFPMPGYTLALDFPVSTGLIELLDRLDEMVVKRGGRVYLAKDARMRPEIFRAMYPKLDQWRAVKADADANNRFSSNLGRRLEMLPA